MQMSATRVQCWSQPQSLHVCDDAVVGIGTVSSSREDASQLYDVIAESEKKVTEQAGIIDSLTRKMQAQDGNTGGGRSSSRRSSVHVGTVQSRGHSSNERVRSLTRTVCIRERNDIMRTFAGFKHIFRH